MMKRAMRVDDSSNVRSISYDSQSDWPLTVEFSSGAVYRYRNVQQHQFAALCGAESVGSAIRQYTGQPKNYPCEKIGGPSDLADRKTMALQLIASLERELGGETTNYQLLFGRAVAAAKEALK